MNLNLVEAQAPFRRGRILLVLDQSNTSGCSPQLLRTMIRQAGYKYDEDTSSIDLAWLSRHGLISRREVAGVELLTITARGRDVASRDLDLPGVDFAVG